MSGVEQQYPASGRLARVLPGFMVQIDFRVMLLLRRRSGEYEPVSTRRRWRVRHHMVDLIRNNWAF